MQNLCILVDYLTFSSKIHSVENIIEMLGLELGMFSSANGFRGWTSCINANNVKILFGGRDDIGIDISGSGCRFIETVNCGNFDWVVLLGNIFADYPETNVSRLDIACDDRQGLLSMDRMHRHVERNMYVSKSKCDPLRFLGRENVIYFGKTKVVIRIYDKALEKGLDGEHWIRVEMQLRDYAADSFIENLLSVGESDIGRTYSGVLCNYLRFVTENPEGLNYARLKTVRWWSDFLGTSEKIRTIIKPGLEYNLEVMEDFLKNNCASTIRAYIQAHDGDVTPLLNIASVARLNEKQKVLLENRVKEI